VGSVLRSFIQTLSVKFSLPSYWTHEMKLIRFGKVGKEKPGVLLEDGARLDSPHSARSIGVTREVP
jgi:hypothetical protein